MAWDIMATTLINNEADTEECKIPTWRSNNNSSSNSKVAFKMMTNTSTAARRVVAVVVVVISSFSNTAELVVVAEVRLPNSAAEVVLPVSNPLVCTVLVPIREVPLIPTITSLLLALLAGAGRTKPLDGAAVVLRGRASKPQSQTPNTMQDGCLFLTTLLLCF
jgi:hypothetical protein